MRSHNRIQIQHIRISMQALMSTNNNSPPPHSYKVIEIIGDEKFESMTRMTTLIFGMSDYYWFFIGGRECECEQKTSQAGIRVE